MFPVSQTRPQAVNGIVKFHTSGVSRFGKSFQDFEGWIFIQWLIVLPTICLRTSRIPIGLSPGFFYSYQTARAVRR